jgi:hypothetical protein
MSDALSPSQQQGLDQVVGLMQTHNLAVGDVKKALAGKKKKDKNPAHKELSKGELVLRLFVYLGGSLIFAGLGVFIHTIWEDIGSLSRVIITFGAGFTAYLVGVVFSFDPRFEKAATPAYIFAFLLQPLGLFVLLEEYAAGDDAALGSMVVFAPLAIQQGLTFLKFRRTSLLLFSLLYFMGFVMGATEYYDFDRGLVSLMFGTFLFFTTVDMHRRIDFKDLTPLFYFISTVFLFAGLYYYVGRTVFDPVALSAALAMLFFAVTKESKTLYVLSVIYIAAYFCGGPGGGWDVWTYFNEISLVFTGASLLLAGHWLKKTNYISLYPLWMFLGAANIYSGFFALVEGTLLEALFVALSVLGIYGSLLLRSRAVLAASVIALIGYISYFTSEHFADTVGWPLLLMFLGFVTLGAGFLFARLSGRIKTAQP